MKLSEDELFEKYSKKLLHCNLLTLLSYEVEFNCISCGYQVNKRKHELNQTQPKKRKLHQLIKICRTQNFLYWHRCI